VTLVFASCSKGHPYWCKTRVLWSRTLFSARGVCAPGCLVRLRGACAAFQPLSVCAQMQQPLLALSGSMFLALQAQLLSVCAQVQQPLIALLGSMVLALPAQLLCLPLSLSLLIHCVGKANMAGAAPVAQTLVSTCSNCHHPNLLARCCKSNPDMLARCCKSNLNVLGQWRKSNLDMLLLPPEHLLSLHDHMSTIAVST